MDKILYVHLALNYLLKQLPRGAATRLSTKLKIHPGTISRLRNGGRRSIDEELISKIASGFCMRSDELIRLGRAVHQQNEDAQHYYESLASFADQFEIASANYVLTTSDADSEIPKIIGYGWDMKGSSKKPIQIKLIRSLETGETLQIRKITTAGLKGCSR